MAAGGRSGDRRNLRVLLANQSEERLAALVPIVSGLGHQVIATASDVERVAEVTHNERPDVALVGLGDSSQHALELIDQIVTEAACPAIALIYEPEPDFVEQASRRGVFAAVTSRAPEEWQNALDVVLHRFAEYHRLGAALDRQATIECAKGILMERHCVDRDAAFALLRGQARNANRRIIDLAAAVVDGHSLLPAHDSQS